MNKSKILIVDDRVENLISLEAILSDLEVDIVRALSGKEAIAQTEEHDFAIALVDILMPEMDGFETVDLLRKNSQTANLPVIFVTAAQKEEYHEVKGIEIGAVDFMIKPIVPAVLLGKIRVFLNLYNQRIQLANTVVERDKALLELGNHQDHLEQLIEERTTETETTNKKLKREIVEHKRAEEAIHKAAHQWQTTFDGIGDAICVIDSEMNILQCNQAMSDFLGKDLEDIIGYSCCKLVHQSEEPIENCPFIRMKKSKRKENYVLQVGDTHLDVTVHPLIDDNNNLTGAVHIVSDISIRKQAEDALQESDERFRMALRNTAITVFSQDKDLNYTWVYNMAPGFDAAAILGKTDADLVSAEDAEKPMALKHQVIKTGQGARTEASYIQNGEQRYYDLMVEPLVDTTGEITGVTCLSLDITERRRAEEALLESEGKYRNLVETIVEGIANVDQNETFVYVNQAAADIFGFSKAAMIGKSMREFTSPETFQKILKYTAMRKKGDSSFYEIPIQRKNGEQRIITITATPTIDKNGEYQGAFGIFHDITDRKQAEEELRESAVYLDIMGDALIVLDSKARMTKVNQSFSELWGYKPEEVVGKPVFGMFPEEELSIHQTEMENAVNEGDTRIFETTALTKDKKEIVVSASGRVLKDGKGKVLNFIALFRDITKVKQTEELQHLKSDFAITLGRQTSLKKILKSALSKIFQLGEFDSGGIYLINDETGAADLVEHQGLPNWFVDIVKHFDSDDLRIKMVKEGTPIYQHATDFPSAINKELKKEGIRALAVIPFGMGDEIIGALNLASHTHDILTEESKNIVETIAESDLGSAITRVKALGALHQSEEKFRTVFENSPDIVALTDLKGAFIDVNHVAPGYTKEDVIGTGFTDYLTPKQKQLFKDTMKKAIKTSKPQGYEVDIPNPEGRTFSWYNRICPIDSGGKITQTVINCTDITERKQVEEELLKTKTLLSDAEKTGKIGGWVVNLETMTQTWTEETYRIHEVDLDFKPDVSKGISFYAPAARPIIERAFQNTVETGEPFDLELEFITAKGNKRWVHSVGKAQQEAGVTKVVSGSFQDITVRKLAEHELAKHRDHLEELVEERTGDLQKTINLMAGREVRMADLKEVITKLRRQLESAGLTPVADDPLKV